VDQCGSLERVVGTFLLHVVGSEAAELDRAIADFSKAVAMNSGFKNYAERQPDGLNFDANSGSSVLQSGRVIVMDSFNVAAYFNRGRARYDKGDLDEAIADFNTAIALEPRNAATYDSRGSARQAKGDLDSAISDFKMAIELNPLFADAFYNRGNATRKKRV